MREYGRVLQRLRSCGHQGSAIGRCEGTPPSPQSTPAPEKVGPELSKSCCTKAQSMPQKSSHRALVSDLQPSIPEHSEEWLSWRADCIIRPGISQSNCELSLEAHSSLCQVYSIRAENKGECALAAGRRWQHLLSGGPKAFSCRKRLAVAKMQRQEARGSRLCGSVDVIRWPGAGEEPGNRCHPLEAQFKFINQAACSEPCRTAGKLRSGGRIPAEQAQRVPQAVHHTVLQTRTKRRRKPQVCGGRL